MRSIGPLLLLIVATWGCGSQLDAPMSDDQPPTERSGAEAQQAAGKPRLWLDEDSAAMIAAVSGYASTSDHVYGESVPWLDFSLDAASLLADGDADPPETGEQDRAL